MFIAVGVSIRSVCSYERMARCSKCRKVADILPHLIPPHSSGKTSIVKDILKGFGSKDYDVLMKCTEV